MLKRDSLSPKIGVMVKAKGGVNKLLVLRTAEVDVFKLISIFCRFGEGYIITVRVQGPHLSFSPGVFVSSALELELFVLSVAICRRSSFLSFSSSVTSDFRFSISSRCSRIILSCFQIHAFKVPTKESTLDKASNVDCIELISPLNNKLRAAP